MLKARDLTPWGFGNAENTNSVNPIISLQKEMDQIFDGFFRGAHLVPTNAANDGKMLLTPRINISEAEIAYQVSTEIPGVDEKDVEVKLVNGVLTIKGEKHFDSEENSQDYHRVERSYGSFSRSIRLPDDADPDNIIANYKKGVLSIAIPKKAEILSQSKRIEIKTDE